MANRLAWMMGVLVLSTAASGQLPPTPGEVKPGTTRGPQIFLAQRDVDLGTVPEGDRAPIAWVLENRGSEDLIIERTRSGCGCTVVQLADEEKMIPPGGSLELKAEFNSTGRQGLQKKSIQVYSNDPTEPVVELKFQAMIETLYTITPPTLLNLRAVRRGEAASNTLDVLPGPGRGPVIVKEVEIPDELPLSRTTEEFEAFGSKGQRIRFTVDDGASLGLLAGQVKVVLSVDGVERDKVIPIRAEVVGALNWSPTILDATRQTLFSGRRLAPVAIRSTEKTPFDIRGVTVGPPLEATFQPTDGAAKGSDFSVHLTVRDDAAPGPFATTLEVRTDSLDQPWIGVPIFGIVSPPVTIDPPYVLLRDDGTSAGRRRRVKLMAAPSTELELTKVTCDNPAVRVEVDREAGAPYRHLRYLVVELVGALPKGTHQTVIRVATSLERDELLEIPVTIDAGQGK